MEIKISDGIVRPVTGGIDAPMTPIAIQARTIANLLPLMCQRLGATIVHNQDSLYTGIRFDTKAGAVVLEIPRAKESYRLVHEFIEPDKKTGRTGKVIHQIPQLYSANGIAHMTSEFLRSRGFLA
ncbi:hypothetical protein ACFRIC_38785 [Streptomyces sp. NPDC056738]|uniref:hypothetical protein n=1 Tax=Streptomyces sp. NPDC056738 TaxID=3345933 RepID=UPI00367E33DF